MSNVEKERLRAFSGLTVSQAAALSGADLYQKALAVASGTTLGPGIDGARLAQLARSSGVTNG